ncbi:hypothetical protein BJ742DRAFT_767785 [Cladochytrium replicatum]|nr:hypothetical protein BJ742DRAFT_767785 [Cladochytrium replicatum]
MDRSSTGGYLDVLDWWKSSILILTWSADAMDAASANGDLSVLHWWKSSGLRLLWSEKAIDRASRARAGLVGFERTGANMESFRDGFRELEGASVRTRMVEIKRTGSEMSVKVINLASENGHVDALEWGKSSGLQLKCNRYAIDNASSKGHLEVLKCCKANGLEIRWSEVATTNAIRNGHTELGGGNRTGQSRSEV